MTTASVVTHARFQPEPSVTLDRAVADFLDRLAITGSGSVASRRTYASVLAAFAAHAGPTGAVADVFTRAAVDRFFSGRSQLAPATWNRDRSILRSFAVWCLRGDLITIDPTDRIEYRSIRTSDIRAVPYVYIERLLDDRRFPVRDRALWAMLYSTAARASEILGLDIGDLDLAQRRGQVRGKGGATELVFWDTRTARLLPRLIDGRGDGPLFLTDRRASTGVRAPAPDDLCPTTGRARLSYRRAEALFQEASKQIDPHGQSWTLHQLRHSATQHAADRGRTAHELQSKTRHRHLATLGKYLRPNPDTAERVTREDDPANRKPR